MIGSPESGILSAYSVNSSLGPYASGAQTYIRTGWQGVLPGDIGGNGVVPAGYSGRNGAYPAEAQVHQWMLEHASASLALRVPGDVLGIDVDAYDEKPGAATLYDLIQECGALPLTFKSTSRMPDDLASGIYFFRVPEGIEWITELPGVEFIQRKHRWARVWPSIAPRTGNIYRWYYGMDARPMDPPSLKQLPQLPLKWVERLRDDKPRSASSVSMKSVLGRERGAAEQNGHSDSKVDLGLLLTPGAVTEMQEKHLRDAVWKLAHSGLSRADGIAVVSNIISCFVDNPASGKRPWEPDGDAEAYWDRAKRNGAGTEASSIFAWARGELTQGVDTEDDLFLDSNDLDTIAPVLPLIDGVLNQGSITWLSGKFGTYKTFVALGWACSVATGRPWAGRLVAEPGPVVYVAAEGHSGLKSRVRAWTSHFGTDIPRGG